MKFYYNLQDYSCSDIKAIVKEASMIPVRLN